ncbi:MAG: chloride channel protein, partial [Rhodobacterales bacterium]|nr:chloride channel protein [Rhodobacterales bacterium]
FVVVGFLEKFEPALVVSGMAAVTGAVIGAPLCMVVIVMELTSSYIYALASLVGLTLSVSLSHILFGASYFDRQLGARGRYIHRKVWYVSHGKKGVRLCIIRLYSIAL